MVIQNLRTIRTERGLSQMEIAELLDTTQQQYSKYENGQNEIPVRHIITLCRFYGISADWLLGLKDTRE
ncbi:MAG: helix-turn-helix transcriptional regulator [Oscillospiraceae bacterium]|nr:helix-turn-helix transcriptional regulator [Oscillospiraceae bacterium]